MDIDQLRMILDALHGAGTATWWFGVLWLSVGVLKSLLTTGIFVAAFFTVYKLARALMSMASFCGKVERVTGVYFSDRPGRQDKFCEWLRSQNIPTEEIR